MKPIPSITENSNKCRTTTYSVLAFATLVLASCSGESAEPVQSLPVAKTTQEQPAATASVSEGQKLFENRCGTCHSVKPGEASPIGPVLAGLIGRPTASVKGFFYSNAMKAYDETWTTENLDKFLENPTVLVPNNRMAFAGLKKANQRRLIIEYIENTR